MVRLLPRHDSARRKVFSVRDSKRASEPVRKFSLSFVTAPLNAMVRRRPNIWSICDLSLVGSDGRCELSKMVGKARLGNTALAATTDNNEMVGLRRRALRDALGK